MFQVSIDKQFYNVFTTFSNLSTELLQQPIAFKYTGELIARKFKGFTSICYCYN